MIVKFVREKESVIGWSLGSEEGDDVLMSDDGSGGVAGPAWPTTIHHSSCLCSVFSALSSGCSSFPVTVLRLFCRASASDHGPPCPAQPSSTCPTVPLLYLRSAPESNHHHHHHQRSDFLPGTHTTHCATDGGH